MSKLAFLPLRLEATEGLLSSERLVWKLPSSIFSTSTLDGHEETLETMHKNSNSFFLLFFSGFDDYLKKLTPEKNERNFWFRDYWEDLFDCYIDQSSYELRERQNRKPEKRNLCDPQKR